METHPGKVRPEDRRRDSKNPGCGKNPRVVNVLFPVEHVAGQLILPVWSERERQVESGNDFVGAPLLRRTENGQACTATAFRKGAGVGCRVLSGQFEFERILKRPVHMASDRSGRKPVSRDLPIVPREGG